MKWDLCSLILLYHPVDMLGTKDMPCVKWNIMLLTFMACDIYPMNGLRRNLPLAKIQVKQCKHTGSSSPAVVGRVLQDCFPLTWPDHFKANESPLRETCMHFALSGIVSPTATPYCLPHLLNTHNGLCAAVKKIMWTVDTQ